MLAKARSLLEDIEDAMVTRVDVPGRGGGDDVSDAGVRASVQAVIPALQSGSLFGERTGLLVMDAHQLQKVEAEIIAEVVASADPSSVVAVFVAAGAIPAPLGKTLKSIGDVVSIKRLNERGSAAWIQVAARDRGVRIGAGVVDALVQRFGTDVASLGQALDQLAASGEDVTAEVVRTRFRNRPDEPSWHFMDAVTAGNRGEALRRLEDFLQHGHPLVLLATIHNDLRRRCLAAAAGDYDTFAKWDGGARNFGMEKVWKQRGRVKASDLTKALDAVGRADLHLKTRPEATHRVMMERLTVAICLWYGGAR